MDPEVLLYNVILGTLSDRDLYIHFYLEPRIRALVYNYEKLRAKYGEGVVLSYLRELISQVRPKNIIERIKVLTISLASMPQSKVIKYTPVIYEFISEVESEAVRRGLYTPAVKEAFDRLYNALSTTRPNLKAVLAALYRLHALLAAGEESRELVQKEVEAAAKEIKYRRFEETGPTLVVKKPAGKGVDPALLKLFVKYINEKNDKGEYPSPGEAVVEFTEKYKDKVGDMVYAHSIMTEAINRGFVVTKKGKLYITAKGKNYVK